MTKRARLWWLFVLLMVSAPVAATITISANGDPVGPVTVNVGDTVFLDVTADACANVQGGNSVWRDTWSNAGQPEQNLFATSPCSVPSFGRTVSFPAAGTYTVSFTSEFCRNFRFFDCRTGWEVDQSDDIVVIVIDPDALTCFEDTFTGGTLNPDDWVTSVSRGNFTPGVASNGRLRMTQAVSNQATAATLQREIPGADNLVILEFNYYAYGGNGADGLAIALSDATITPQPGSYGGSLGYAQRNNGDPGFAGGWLGIGLDEYGNFSNPNEGRQGGPGFRRDAVAIRGAAPDYRYLAGTNTLAPGIDQPNTANPSPHRYRITVDSRGGSQALVSVERDLTATGNNYQTLVAPFDALAQPGQPGVPENFLLSLTGSTGGSNNIHELDEVQLCALKLNPVGAQVDHFEILHDGTALTCQAESVTIRACANNDCSSLFTDPVAATMSPAGWVGGNTVNITGGVATASFQRTTPGSVTLGVLGSQPSTRPQSITLCQSGGGVLSAANCSLPFLAAGLAFEIPDQVAARESGTIQISAVRQDDVTQACVPAFANVDREVAFWSSYLDPATGLSASPPISVSGVPVGGSAAAATPLTLAFNAQGRAEITLNYPEAGQMQLDARYTGSTASGDQGLVLPGADSFVSMPAGFCLQATVPESACGALWDQCSVLAAAGDPFQVSLRAVAWETSGENGADFCAGNATTRNFRVPSLALSHQLLAPTPGVLGNLGVTSQAMTGTEAGSAVFDQSISEVGVFELQMAAGQNYLGRALPGAESTPVGRLTPASFAIDAAATDPGTLAPGCPGADPFSYTGQPVGWSVAPEIRIRALSRTGTLTSNYTRGGFLKLTAADIGRTLPSQDQSQLLADASAQVPVSYTANAATLSAPAGAHGIMAYGFSSADQLSYEKVAGARVGPFSPDLELRIDSIQDSDGIVAPALPYALAPASPFELRYGRLNMQNVYGPENIASLAMPFLAEYWTGDRFLLHGADSCSGWDTMAVGGSSDHHNLQADSGTLSNGTGGPLVLVPTGSQGTDTLIWQQPVWLQDFWNDSATLQNPSALATFGVYRGHDRVIDWRER